MSTKQKVAEFTIRPLKFDAKLAANVMTRRAKDESLTAIAKALGITTGKAKMAQLVATTKRVEFSSPAALARAVAKDREGGASWALLAARYAVTEGTVRAAYEAATGKPFATLDYRKGRR